MGPRNDACCKPHLILAVDEVKSSKKQCPVGHIERKPESIGPEIPVYSLSLLDTGSCAQQCRTMH